ncbi:TraB/GumN family protein [Salicibibacter kimchii]|uniref:TraB/GumN family protein n=1 Tax=Salicibibacter kimchii TaxID=2099786 RepID=A0A345C015_9BACI|nr:TraB/GumN family protein [Salicibibacter kimchii]
MRYKAFISMLLSILLLAACQNSSDGTGGFLWEVEEGDTNVYLQGTIHLGEEDFYPLQSNTEEAYEEADVVLPEINTNDIDTDDMQSHVMDLATYDGTMTLEDHLPADLYAEVEGTLESLGFEAKMFDNFQPWYIEMLLLQLAIEQTDYDAQHSVDQYFLDRAEEDGKEIVELESYEDQMEMLAGFSDDTQIECLKLLYRNGGTWTQNWNISLAFGEMEMLMRWLSRRMTIQMNI